ncbi:MAG: class I SAM-dependent methyltransferase [Lachnospiraceae bacterium]
MGKETLTSMLDYFINDRLQQLILSNPVAKDQMTKVKIRPFLQKDEVIFQAEELIGRQAFHKNMSDMELKQYITERLEQDFRQAEVLSVLGTASVLVSKKGTVTVKMKKTSVKMEAYPMLREHNRKKQYLIQEGTPVPFLEDLGVMTAEGKIVRSRYDKFRQINRFLEFVEDILPQLDKTKETVILDFGCGKSYLTFAMYYYLHQLKGYPVRMIGLDLKRDVIERCNQLAKGYGFEKLNFYHGDIASYEGADQVDMVVTLHACDTATDYALEKAVRLGARVILSVPCCQHELNRQIDSPLMQPIHQYGLLRERMAALYTDGIRAELLEHMGYRTQILEFIDMEHTPKNILIRAVKEGKPKDNRQELESVLAFLNAEPTLYQLLMKDQTTITD